jgi:hypothetical protein
MSGIPGMNLAILDFCTRLDDGPRDEAAARREMPRRDPAEYKWLREAMDSIEQPERKMLRLLKVLDTPDTLSSENDDTMAALEEINDMVEDINMATEYMLMKGPARAMKVLTVTRDSEVRRLIAMIVGNSAQNHEKVQQAYLDLKAADTFIPLMVNETNEGTRAALVYAVSSLCRSYAPAGAAFLKAGGLGALLALINTYHATDAKSVGRCLRLAGYFAEVHATTAVPVAEASCRLATVDTTSAGAADNGDTADANPANSPQVVTTAAADCALQVLQRAAGAGEDGCELLGYCLGWLGGWAASGRVAETPEHKALADAVKSAAKNFGAGTSTNKHPAPPSAASHPPAPAAGTGSAAPLLLQ